ncbi:MAG: hypothetical protein KAH23_03805 [Kiritimatiellae bacterium]|nr:hypothetical protein [Kiritimatiellia bacterium]
MADISLFLLSIFAGVTTFLVIGVHITWIALSYAMRKRGCKVTYIRHDWARVKASIATVVSQEERQKYERWEVLLRYTYFIWGMMMILFVLLAFFVCS